MSRRAVFVSIFASLLLGGLALSQQPVVGAQEGTPRAMAGHPFVGAWELDTDTNDPSNPPSLSVFNRDGTYLQLDPDGSGVGVWKPTGPRSAALTILFHNQDQNGGVATVKVRANGEVDASGDTFTATYTLEVILPDGTSSGETGPGTATGTRIAVEPMGTPVGPLMGPEGTPVG